MYDVIIIGGGPAACSAGVYAGRKKLKTLFLTDVFGGQSIVSDNIENWIGTKSISGYDLAKNLEEHVRLHEEVEVVAGVKAESIKEIDCGFEVKTEKEAYQTRTVMIATGARRRRLGVPGEDKLDGHGVAFCSTCDAPLFRGKTVAVIGGGNAGLEAVLDLKPYASSIYLLNVKSDLSGDQETQAELNKLENFILLNNAKTLEIMGSASVTALKYQDLASGEEKELQVDGVFIEIGSVPNSELAKDLVEINQHGEIVVDHKTYQTSKKGIYAAGDVTDEIYKQNNIAAGDAITAILSIYNYLSDIKKQTPASECP